MIAQAEKQIATTVHFATFVALNTLMHLVTIGTNGSQTKMAHTAELAKIVKTAMMKMTATT